MHKRKIIGIIPTRMGSTRFPGKPLAPIHGMPMIGHVYHRSKQSKLLDEVYFSTYDFEHEIIAYASSIGAKVAQANTRYERPSDITAHALREIEKETGEKIDIVVMIQGDEPMVTPEMIDLALGALVNDPSVGVANLMAPITTDAEHEDPNCPKVVVDTDNNALYFSREAIPSKKKWSGGAIPRFKQVCIMPFTREFLMKFNELAPTPLEKVESIDMNRFLEHGYKVKMVLEEFETQCVDTPKDLEKVKEMMLHDRLRSTYARS